jgi:transglutaminase-like putative cysteine protease
MKREAPPLLLAAAILLWGQQTGLWWIAGLGAALIEIPRLLRRRELSTADFRRITYLCTALVLGAAVLAFATRPLGIARAATVEWFPIACFPLVLAQRISIRGRVPVRSLFPLFAKMLSHPIFDSVVDVTFPYFALCLFAASSANSQTIWFYVELFVAAAWTLWLIKPKTTRVAVWITMLVAAALIGYAGHVRLHAFQATVERTFAGFVPGGGQGPASNVRDTAIGSVGTLKFSGRIVLRVQPQGGGVPGLLHTATFTSYAGTQWMAPNGGYAVLPSNKGARSWDVGSSSKQPARARIAMRLSTLPAWLPVPDRSVRIESPDDMLIRRDRFGTLQIDDSPSITTYDVSFGSDASTDAAPENADLFVPAARSAVFTRVAQELHLESMSPQEKVKAIANYFQDNFSYSLYQPNRDVKIDPLENFLTKTHSGHCEYFATSTVLLLRAAGVPARYAIGFSVQEWSSREQAYVVRDRHAHAWTRVYVGSNWVDLDTTPGTWINIENARASQWENASDWLSFAWFRLLQWRRLHGNLWTTVTALLAVIALGIWGFRFISRKRVAAGTRKQQSRSADGIDSDFYRIERLLDRAGFGRRAAESMQAWIQRLETTGGNEVSIDALRPLLALHYRYRFDPHGLRTQDRARLKFLTESWLSEHSHLRTWWDKIRGRR